MAEGTKDIDKVGKGHYNVGRGHKYEEKGENNMKKQNDFHATVRNLMLLDPESLLLIDSGVKLLLARQGMVKKAEEKTGKRREEQAVV